MLEKWSLTNYYDILGVDKNSTYEEIYMAYSNAIKTYNPSNPEIGNSFSNQEIIDIRKLIEDAFTVLSNDCIREVYKSKNQTFQKPDKTTSKTIPSPLFRPEVHGESVYKKKMDGKFLESIRKEMGISIEELSSATKIKVHFIHAIESNNYNALPAAVYTRGFIQEISKSLGLDAKRVASSYMNYYF